MKIVKGKACGFDSYMTVSGTSENINTTYVSRFNISGVPVYYKAGYPMSFQIPITMAAVIDKDGEVLSYKIYKTSEYYYGLFYVIASAILGYMSYFICKEVIMKHVQRDFMYVQISLAFGLSMFAIYLAYNFIKLQINNYKLYRMSVIN